MNLITFVLEVNYYISAVMFGVSTYVTGIGKLQCIIFALAKVSGFVTVKLPVLNDI